MSEGGASPAVCAAPLRKTFPKARLDEACFFFAKMDNCHDSRYSDQPRAQG